MHASETTFVKSITGWLVQVAQNEFSLVWTEQADLEPCFGTGVVTARASWG